MTEEEAMALARPCPECGQHLSNPRPYRPGVGFFEPDVLLYDGWAFAENLCRCGYWPTWRQVDGVWEIQ